MRAFNNKKEGAKGGGGRGGEGRGERERYEGAWIEDENRGRDLGQRWKRWGWREMGK